MKNVFFIIIALLFLSSCATFKNPQPFDGKQLTEIPVDWRGDYSCPTDSCISRYVIKENQLEMFDQRQIEEPISSYSTKGGKHFIKRMVNETEKSEFAVEKTEEIFFPVFKNDSVYALTIAYNKFEIGKNLVLMDCGKYHVLNLKFEAWTPILLIQNESFVDLFTLVNKEFENKPRDENGHITSDFTMKEFSKYVRKKTKYFNTSSMHFDIINKKFVPNPYHKESE